MGKLAKVTLGGELAHGMGRWPAMTRDSISYCPKSLQEVAPPYLHVTFPVRKNFKRKDQTTLIFLKDTII